MASDPLPARRLTRRKRVLFGLIPALALLLALEAAARLRKGGDPAGPAQLVFGFAQYSGLVEDDPELFWRFKPHLDRPSHDWVTGRLRTNAWRLRGPELAEPRRAGSRRILCLGDSCTFGFWVREADSYPSLLQAQLGPGVEVVNGGVPGYTSLQGRRFASRLLPQLDPDVVTIMYGWNDLRHGAGGLSDAARPLLSPKRVAVRRFLLRSHALQWITAHRRAPALAAHMDEVQVAGPVGRPGEIPRVFPEETARNLAAIVALARRRQAAVILLTFPMAPADGLADVGVDAAGVYARQQRYCQTIREVGRALRVPVVDADALLSLHAEHFMQSPPDYIHFTETGQLVVAEALAARIRGLTGWSGAASGSRTATGRGPARANRQSPEGPGLRPAPAGA